MSASCLLISTSNVDTSSFSPATLDRCLVGMLKGFQLDFGVRTIGLCRRWAADFSCIIYHSLRRQKRGSVLRLNIKIHTTYVVLYETYE